MIMNLSEMDDADAKRLVDFAAGLTFGLHGRIERVTAKVFLLSPHNVTVTAQDKARIAKAASSTSPETWPGGLTVAGDQVRACAPICAGFNPRSRPIVLASRGTMGGGRSSPDGPQWAEDREKSSMALFWSVIAFALYLYLLLIIARLVVEVARQFARSWRPVGVAAVGIELVYVEHRSAGEGAAPSHSTPPAGWGEPRPEHHDSADRYSGPALGGVGARLVIDLPVPRAGRAGWKVRHDLRYALQHMHHPQLTAELLGSGLTITR